jgi:hypothetical protein
MLFKHLNEQDIQIFKSLQEQAFQTEISYGKIT